MSRTRRQVNCALFPLLFSINDTIRTTPTSTTLNSDQATSSTEAQPPPERARGTSTAPVIRFFVDPNSPAAKWLKLNPDSPDAIYMRKIADNAHAVWLGRWSGNISRTANRLLEQHATQGATPVFVLYNIPGRDNGGYPSGGAGSPDAYYQWVDDLGSAIRDRKAIVILEPDSLALSVEIADDGNRAMRYIIINTAIDILRRRSSTIVYIDGGHPNWHPVNRMVSLLQQGGIAKANGFFVNAANFVETRRCLEYGRAISAKTSAAHFVIDTSRNGRGAPADAGEYCNPIGAALGNPPTVDTGEPLCDAFLWIKVPGESDGPCNGGPAAGRFWPEYAIALARNA